MANNKARSKKLIAPYLRETVTAKLDGTLFDHVPATFRFRFLDPEELAEHLAEMYSDELTSKGCLDDDGEWCSDELVPVAAVSKFDDDEDDDEPYEFAWLFLKWSGRPDPSVVVATSDDWDLERTAASIAALGLAVR